MYPQDERSQWSSGKSPWQDIPETLWNDWTWQLKNRISNPASLKSYLELSNEEEQGLSTGKERLAFAVTPYFLSLMNPHDKEDPLRLQVIPREQERHCALGESLDPIAEERFSPVPGIIHRYQDRALILATNTCASYCRYCTRSRLVSHHSHFSCNLPAVLDYIKQHQEIRDVLISGGDPLLLSDQKLDALLTQLRAIPHIEFIRMGSRVPVFLPQRITNSLCDILKKHQGIWLSLHVNHPNECTQTLAEALERLSFAGVVLGSQSVLLRKINDSANVLRSLFHRLVQMRVRPYYLYTCDRVQGTGHFYVPLEEALALFNTLRGNTSGYALPRLVQDTPEHGKVFLA